MTRETPAPVAGTGPRLERARSTTEVILLLAYFAGGRGLTRPVAYDDVAGSPAPPHLLRGQPFPQAYQNLPQAAGASGSMAAMSFCLTLFMARSIGRTVNTPRSEQQILIER